MKLPWHRYPRAGVVIFIFINNKLYTKHGQICILLIYPGSFYLSMVVSDISKYLKFDSAKGSYKPILKGRVSHFSNIGFVQKSCNLKVENKMPFSSFSRKYSERNGHKIGCCKT